MPSTIDLLTFEIEREPLISSGNLQPKEGSLLSKYEKEIESALINFVAKINASGGYMLIMISKEGKPYTWYLRGCGDELIAEVMAYLNDKQKQ